MKVDNPKFDSVNPPRTCKCVECPFANEDGWAPHDSPCGDWGATHDVCCPTEETYAEACTAAEVTNARP